MANTYFFTGFPGFIATSLIKQIITSGYEVNHIYLLVLPDLIHKAENDINKIASEEGMDVRQFSIIPGDITKPHLDLSPEINYDLSLKVTHVFHLAAIYDLAVPKDIAYTVNVNGTKNVNEWVLGLRTLKRYVYFSTAYVSGSRTGKILETELEMNQAFKNHYEHTKYEAEVLVQKVKEKVPTTIIRPGIVKGHSQTGETLKFDGPYFILNFFDRLRFLPLIPYLGMSQAEGNFVPIDYVLEAVIYLSHSEAGIGKTYHLTDPKPYPMNEVYRLLMEKYLGRKPIGMIPLSSAKLFLSVSAFRKWLRLEKEALDYSSCMAQYDCTQTQNDLSGSGIVCPSFGEALDSMVEYYRENKNDPSKQLKIT